MPLQSFVDGGPPVIGATWLNKVDVLLFTVFDEATSTSEALTALGISATGQSIFTAASAAAAVTALGGTATGSAVFTAASAGAGRTALGAGATGSTLFTAASAAAALATLGGGAAGIAVLQAATAADARTALGLTTPYDLTVAASDETTSLVAANGVVSFRWPRSFTLSSVKASLNTASSSGIVTIDVNQGGVSIFSTRITIDVGETTSTTAVTPSVLSTTAMTADSIVTVDIDIAGTGADGLKLYFLGTLP